MGRRIEHLRGHVSCLATGMPRTPRRHLRGEYHHVINRGNARATIFFHEKDYQAFIRLLAAAVDKYGLGLLGYCVMPNHWHLLLRPASQPDMSRALHWLTSLHARRWAREHAREGPGHVYQGRFLSVPVEPGVSVWRVLRYVERNAAAAGLVHSAEAWPWCSVHQRQIGGQIPTLLHQPFLPEPAWREHLNTPEPERDIREAIRRNLPIGSEDWVKQRCAELGIAMRKRPGRQVPPDE